MTNEEILINFLINKFTDSKTNKVSISKNDLSQMSLTEQEVVKTIYLLQEENLLEIKERLVHDDLSRYWTVVLKSSCIHYFDNKKDKSVANRREWVRTYIPITISIVALIKSFLPEIILVMERLSKLLGQLLK